VNALSDYQRRRNFERTPEPRGRVHPTGHGAFVVHLRDDDGPHYELGLESGGMLLTWRLPQGPSLDPKQARDAERLENRPVEYADFEGVVPEGEPGAGRVLVWDRGSWFPSRQVRSDLPEDELEFALHGQKLSGHWRLTRSKDAGDAHWRLTKDRDDAAREDAPPIVEQLPSSVLSGRRLDDLTPTTQPRPHHSPTLPTHLTDPSLVLLPDAGIDKRALAEYYARVASHMLPHLRARPLVLWRCPGGVGRRCERLCEPPPGSELSLRRIHIGDEHRRSLVAFAVDDRAALLELARLQVVEIHDWSTRVDGGAYGSALPDRLVFELVPGRGARFSDAVDAARELHEQLRDLQLRSFVKTSGRDGLDVVVPIVPTRPWELTASLARALADTIATRNPHRFTTDPALERRIERVLIDTRKNAFGRALVSPYSPRVGPHAEVSTPLDWDELRSDLDPAALSVVGVPIRLDRLTEDPWRDFFTVRQRLSHSHTRATASMVGAP
jgi:bifunctional non-homologous end joining protein LigD